MPALLISVLAGTIVGWFCKGRYWRALSLSVLASAAAFGVTWCLRSEPQEVEAQWLASQPGFWIFTYMVGYLLPCAGAAAITTALYRQVRRKGSNRSLDAIGGAPEKGRHDTDSRPAGTTV